MPWQDALKSDLLSEGKYDGAEPEREGMWKFLNSLKPLCPQQF